MYEQYASNFELAACKVSECLKRDPSFYSFLESCQSSQRCAGLSLFSFLMLPLHRVVSYNEDLEMMLMLTREGDDDRANVQRSFDRVSSLCSKLQEKLIRAQELEELWVLQQATTGTYSSFLEPNRRIVIQDWAVLAGQLGEKKRSMVLFNDGLVCLSPTDEEEDGGEGAIRKQMLSRHKYEYKWIDNLVGASVTLGTTKTRGQFVIIFKSARKDYTFYLPDRSKQQLWCVAARASCCCCLTLRQVRRTSGVHQECELWQSRSRLRGCVPWRLPFRPRRPRHWRADVEALGPRAPAPLPQVRLWRGKAFQKL